MKRVRKGGKEDHAQLKDSFIHRIETTKKKSSKNKKITQQHVEVINQDERGKSSVIARRRT